MKKIWLLLQDDWEIRGNGLGNVAHLQYLPLLFILELADLLNIKLNFMVEVLQQIAFNDFAHNNRNIRIQSNLWDNCVLMMKERGHDVQLHLHPQWYKCKYQNGYFILSSNWNIATYGKNDRKSMIDLGISYLTNLITPIDPSYKVIVFKAGSWGLQPSKGILEDLEASNIKIVLGPGKGIILKTNNININYEGIEESTLPYYPDFSDIKRLSDKKERLFVLPLPFYRMSTQGFWGTTGASSSPSTPDDTTLGRAPRPVPTVPTTHTASPAIASA